MEGKLMDSFYFATHTRGQDILHIFSSKQTVELLLIETCGQDMLREKFQFMGKITVGVRFYLSYQFAVLTFYPYKPTELLTRFRQV